MQNKTFEFQLRRAELWLNRVQSEYLVDARKLDAVYCATADPVPLAD